MLQSLRRRPRRILMTLDAVGGVWRHAVDLAAGLARRGCEMTLAGLGPEPSGPQRAEASGVARLEWLQAPLDWMAAQERELDRLPSELAALARDCQADLLHLNAPAQAADLDIPCPVVVACHSCIATWFESVRGEPVPEAWRWQVERNRRGFARADAIVAASRAFADMLVARYRPARRPQVVLNATASPAERGREEPFVLAAARWWDEGKNGVVLDAAAERIGWPVTMAGPTAGPNGESVLFQHVCSVGELPSMEMRRLMAHAGIFVSPSRYEPFGLAALEAASAGIPLVLSDIPTYRELWSGAALFFPPQDAEALASAVNTLAQDSHLRQALGRAAMERARAFSPERQARTIAGLHEAAAASVMAE